MRATRLIPFATGVACILTAACVSSPAPPGWLAPADSAQRDPYGAWIEVSYVAETEDVTTYVAGELIAVDPDTLFVLPPADALVAVPTAWATAGRLAYFDAQWWAPALWSAIGKVSTLSHGRWLLLSAPVWLISGPIAAANQSRQPIRSAHHGDRSSWRALGMYARFPLGMPPGLDRRRLRGKP